jgi:hypothetical protein
MEYSVKVSAVKDFAEVMRSFPEIAHAASLGVAFMSLPAPSIDMAKLRAAPSEMSLGKKPGPKM